MSNAAAAAGAATPPVKKSIIEIFMNGCPEEYVLAIRSCEYSNKNLYGRE